jgi:hypothetical protein
MIQGFKELASVCQAIAQGRQTVLLRKAGIRESTHESAFQPKSFYLLPTQYHEKGPKSSSQSFPISLRVEVIRSGDLIHWAQIEKLLPFTAYDPKTIREHFDSRDEKLLHFAQIQSFTLSPVWNLPHSPALSGCRSWFELPPPPSNLTESPISTNEASRRTAQLLS